MSIVDDGNSKFIKSFFLDINNIYIIKLLQISETGFWRFFRSLNPSLIDQLARTFRKRKRLYAAEPNTISFTHQLQSQENYDLIVERISYSSTSISEIFFASFASSLPYRQTPCSIKPKCK
jgi:hypothetical protein